MLDFNKFLKESYFVKNNTNPWYKRGELIVMFKSNVKSDDVVKYILKKVNAEPIKGVKRLSHIQITPYMESDYFIVKTEIGDENRVMELLQSIDDVDWVERRDMKSELRTYICSHIGDEMNILSEDTNVSDKDWKDKISHLNELMLLLISDKYESIRDRFPELKTVIEDKIGM